MRRTESRRDPLDAVRSSFSGGEHRRRCRLERHNARLASGFFQRTRHSGDHPGRAHSAAKRRQTGARLFGQFRADSHVAANRVHVMELVRVERARLLRQFFRALLHSLVQLRHQLAVFRRENLQLRAEKTHGLQLFLRESVRRNGREVVALDRADHRE